MPRRAVQCHDVVVARREQTLRPRLLVALLVAGSIVAGCSSQSRYEPTTTKVAGQTVYLIYPPPPCPKNASCAASVIINKQIYGLSVAIPKPAYRNGPLFAVAANTQARLIPGLSTASWRVLALGSGSTWSLAFSRGVPTTDAVQRQICELAQNIKKDSYCVAHLGFSPTE